MILPGATLGILGGGQLGRMFVHAATAMGYRVIVLDPNASSPAGEIAHLHLQANYDDIFKYQLHFSSNISHPRTNRGDDRGSQALLLCVQLCYMADFVSVSL